MKGREALMKMLPAQLEDKMAAARLNSSNLRTDGNPVLSEGKPPLVGLMPTHPLRVTEHERFERAG